MCDRRERVQVLPPPLYWLHLPIINPDKETLGKPRRSLTLPGGFIAVMKRLYHSLAPLRFYLLSHSGAASYRGRELD